MRVVVVDGFNHSTSNMWKFIPKRAFGKLETYPFPHMVMENFLSWELFHALEKNFPVVTRDLNPDTKYSGGRYLRYRDPAMDELISRHRKFTVFASYVSISYYVYISPRF